MKLLGWEIKRAPLTPVDGSSSFGWRGWPIFRGDWYPGAWQNNDDLKCDDLTRYPPVWSCMTLIASDIAKLRPRYMLRDSDGIWVEVANPAYDPVLFDPNGFQNHIQFKEYWILSKLMTGNTYALKRRDARGVVRRLYILDPSRVEVLVAPDGSVFYQLNTDQLNTLDTPSVVVPASEIIHDRFNCLFHPLRGLSPLWAAAVASGIGLRILKSSNLFFGNNANPGGILTAPGPLPPDTAERLKTAWDTNYGGVNAGKIAVLGDGLKFEPMRMTAVDSQLIDHLRLTVDFVCSTFHVPPFKVGLASLPAGQKVEDMNLIYYTDGLQRLIEDFEACMDSGLEMKSRGEGIDLDLDGLMRMDSQSLMTFLGDGVKAGILSPNEGRRRLDYGPKRGGDTPYLQQQNFSLAALDKRDTQADPFATGAPAPTEEAEEQEEETRSFADFGVWKEGVSYPKGAAVSMDGLWIAQSDNPGKPGNGNKGWRLAVKGGKR